MNDSLLLLEIEGKQLLAVPSIPYRVTFANHVNRICRKQDTKPDAIAVELGPQSTKECALWLKELRHKKNFPCMLALTKDNNRVRSSFKKLAVDLQETSGKDLNDLSPDVLKHLLNYSSKSVLPLSPTDSIIEAIRCAIELKIPFYGVDIEETADAQRKKGKIEDAAGKSGKDLKEYVKRNLQCAEYSRDDEIDERREVAVAAKLKTLLKRHKRVLFTGGLAHWGQIEVLLNKPDLRPAQVQKVNEVPAGNFTRCIAHPLLAIYFMDVFPAFAGYYNHSRRPVNLSDKYVIEDNINPMSFFDDKLKKNYQKYFDKESLDKQDEHQIEDVQAHPVFEQLLSNLCMIKQMLVPDLPAMIEAAQGTMSTQFCEALANEFMDFDWMTNKDFPELPILAPVPLQTAPYMKVEFLYPGGSRSKQFYINLLHDRRSIMSGVSIPWGWNWELSAEHKERDKQLPNDQELISLYSNQTNFDNYHMTWPPRDYLITAMSLDAMQIARRKGRSPVAFQGSLLDGIDIKTTIRAHIRGEKQIYVHDKSIYETQQDLQEYSFDPVVWILNTGIYTNATWHLYGMNLSDAEKYVLNLHDLENAVQKLGKKYMSCASYGTEENATETLKKEGIDNIKSIQGILYFSLPCFRPKQEIKFMEYNNYKKYPLYDGSIEGLIEMFHKRHGIDLDMAEWPVSMVRMALAYAERGATVIVPDSFILPRVVFEEAKKVRVDLNIIPLSYFPKENIEKIITEYCVYPIKGSDLEEFPESAERYLGEKADKNRHLVPKWLLNYGKIVKAVAT